jgi:hypothetical protein
MRDFFDTRRSGWKGFVLGAGLIVLGAITNIMILVLVGAVILGIGITVTCSSRPIN